MTIDLTPEEIIALRQIFHRALMHSGLDVLEAVGHFSLKLREAETAAKPRINGGAAAAASAAQ